jgi:two-component system, NarL family, response regulator NreC
MSIRIILADNHEIIREGLRSLFEKQSGMEVVGEAKDGQEVVQMVQKLSPDIIIMDISMYNLYGIDTTRHIVTNCPDVKILVLSIHSNKRFVTEMFKAGASGYMLKHGDFAELVNAIRVVLTNQVYLSPGIVGILTNDYVRHTSITDVSVRSILTIRECEVLQLLADGRCTKQIALHLGVSAKTVETHRKKIMGKLDTHSIAGLTKYAILEGLISLES